MPLDMDSDVYDMNHPKRGLAVIFNHENHPGLCQSSREGTAKDREDLKAILKKMGFDVKCHDDLTRAQVLREIELLTKEDHSEHHSLLIAVISHGGDSGVLYAKDYSYMSHQLWMPFTADKVKTLAGKPKIFLVQACRGDSTDHGTQLASPTEVNTSPPCQGQGDSIDEGTKFTSLTEINTSPPCQGDSIGKGTTFPRLEVDSSARFQGDFINEGTKLASLIQVDTSRRSYSIPNHADFLIVYCSFPGHFVWRNTTDGSWFIQAVCKVFEKYWNQKDLLSMMNVVSREVALRFESNTPSVPHMHQKKQIPVVTSTLIRDVYLVPKQNSSLDTAV